MHSLSFSSSSLSCTLKEGGGRGGEEAREDCSDLPSWTPCSSGEKEDDDDDDGGDDDDEL